MVIQNDVENNANTELTQMNHLSEGNIVDFLDDRTVVDVNQHSPKILDYKLNSVVGSVSLQAYYL